MDEAVKRTSARVESALAGSPAFRKVDHGFYVVRQGSAYVTIHVLPWAHAGAEGKSAKGRSGRGAIVRLVSQLARGVEITPDLALRLLRLNAKLRFGSFGWVADGACVTLQHTIVGGEAFAPDALLAALGDFALIADEYDDQVVREAGGMTMQALLDEHELTRVSDALLADLDQATTTRTK